jgi:hypothetical protein
MRNVLCIRSSWIAALWLASLALASLARSSAAQTACQGSSGPDVIAGGITAPANYASTGGIDALSMGTVICNMGTAAVSYSPSTNQHPVMGQNLYRLKTVNGSTRFEQIGMGWLMHGFFALASTACCPTCQGTGGSELGVGCSSPDTASANGSQSGLGPRWQVNAFTGSFAYPPANPPFSGSVARRLQVHTSDLEVSGPGSARYFVEAHFVAPDDAAAGPGTNNASYRELAVTSNASEWTFALAVNGTTATEEPAIRAWRDLDPNVVESVVQVPGEGLFVLAHEVTNLGGGVWHYEYALYDMNSDRSARSFSIPIAAGVHVSNAGFHDVDYHDGDGPGDADFDGTDWPAALTGGSLTFATDDFATNPSANALRWGTTYNFRFDADTPPEVGSATIELFKPGSPVQITSPVSVPAAASLWTAYCFGDGSGTACPCANDSLPGSGAGCLNSHGTGGTLSAGGVASVSADSFVLHGAQMPNSSALYFQGTTQQAGGAGVLLGDGLLCAGGTLIRFGVKANSGGASQYPQAGDVPISVKGLVNAGDTHTYQVWYRDPASFCTSFTYNLTPGVQVTWAP